jgi:hypothetical protein
MTIFCATFCRGRLSKVLKNTGSLAMQGKKNSKDLLVWPVRSVNTMPQLLFRIKKPETFKQERCMQIKERNGKI